VVKEAKVFGAPESIKKKETKSKKEEKSYIRDISKIN